MFVLKWSNCIVYYNSFRSFLIFSEQTNHGRPLAQAYEIYEITRYEHFKKEGGKGYRYKVENVLIDSKRLVGSVAELAHHESKRLNKCLQVAANSTNFMRLAK